MRQRMQGKYYKKDKLSNPRKKEKIIFQITETDFVLRLLVNMECFLKVSIQS